MSVFKALDAAEERNEQGWRYSNSYNYNQGNVNNNQHPSSSSQSTPQHSSSFSMSAVGTGRMNTDSQGVKNSVSENETRLMEEFEGDSDEFEGDPDDFDFEGYPEDYEEYPEGFDEGQFEGGQGHFEGGHGYFEGDQGHYEEGQEGFEGDQGQFEEGQEQFEGDPEHFGDDQGHFGDEQGHFEDAQGHFEGKQGHFEGDQQYFEGDQGHYEGDQEQFEDCQEQFEDDQGHFEGGQEQFEGDQENFDESNKGHFEGEQGHFEGEQEHFEGDKEHFEGDQEQSEGDQAHFEENQEQFEGGQGQFDGEQEQFEGEQEQFEGDQEHFKGSQKHEHIESGKGHFKDQRQFKGGQEHFESVPGHFRGQRQLKGGQEQFESVPREFKGQRQFKGGQEHFESVPGQFKGQRQFKGGQEHFESVSGQFKGQRQFKGGQGHFESVPGQIKGQRHFEGGQRHFRSGEGHSKGQGHIEGGQKPFKSGQSQMKERHYEGSQEQFKRAQGHIEDGQKHFKSGQGLFKAQRQFGSSQEQFKRAQGHIEHGQKQFKSGQGPFKDQRQFGGVQEQFKRAQGQFKGQRQFEGGQGQFKRNQGQFKSQTQRQIEGSQEQFRRAQGQFEGGQEHILKSGQRHFEGQGPFEASHEQVQGGPRHFDDELEHFEDYDDEFDFDEDDEYFDEDFDDEDDLEFEDEHGNLIQDSRIESSSGFQNSYNKYIMSQYQHSEDLQSDYDEHSEDEPDDIEHEAEHKQLTSQPGIGDIPSQKGMQPLPPQKSTQPLSPQKSMQPQAIKSAQQGHQMRLPLRVHEGREFSPAPSQSAEPSREQQNVDQKSAGPHQMQQEEARAGQSPSPRQPVSQGLVQQVGNVTTLQAKPQQPQQRQAASEVTVTSHNVTVSTYNRRHKNSSQLVSQNQQAFPRMPYQRMPNQRINPPNQYHYQFPGQGVRYAAQGHKQGARRNWHMPQKEHASHAYQHERRQQASSEMSKFHNTEQKRKGGEEPGFLPHGNRPPRQTIPPHLLKRPPHPRMQNSPHAPVRGTPGSWHVPRGPPKTPSVVQHSSQGTVHGSPKVAAQKSQMSEKQSAPMLQRPQVKQNLPQMMRRHCPPGSSGISHQGESRQGGGKQPQQHAKQKTLGQEMQQLFNLPSQPRVIVQGGRGNQSLRENTFYSIQRSGTASNGTILYSGMGVKKYLQLTKPGALRPQGFGQAQQRANPSHGNKGRGRDNQDPATGVHTTSEDPRSEQGGSATPPTSTNSVITTADSSTAHSKAGHSADSSSSAATRDQKGGDNKHAPDSATQCMMEDGFPSEAINGGMDDSFDSDMMDYDDEDFDDEDDDFDDEDYFDEEEELEHDAVMREIEMEEMGNLSPPPLPLGVPQQHSKSKAGWPTPLPSMNEKKAKEESDPGAAGVEFVSSSNQRACNSPVFGFSPRGVSKERASSSPGPSKDSQLTPLEPVQPSIPADSELKERCAKRPLADDEEGTTLCQHCGHHSSNLDVCERCQRSFPPDVEVFIKRRKIDTPDSVFERERTCGGGKVNPPPSEEAGFVLDKKTFYGNKTSARRGSYSDDDGDSADHFVIRNTQRTFRRLQGNKTNFPNQHKVFRGVKEPVTVTISSDEDEGPSGDQGQQGSSSKLTTLKRVSATSVTTTTTTTVAAAAAAAAAVPVSQSQEKDEGFFSAPAVKPTSSFGMARRNRMEDAAGRCNPRPRSPLMRFVGEGIYFNVRGIRIGTMRTSGVEVRFMTRSIAFTVISDRTQEELDFFVYVTDIKTIAFTLQPPQPVAFLHVTPGCGARLRSHLKMMNGSPECFDPGSRDPQKNKIVIIIETMTDEPGLRDMLGSYIRTLKCEDFLTELDCEDANDLLVSSTPPILTNVHSLPFEEEDAHPSPTPSGSGGVHEHGEDEDGGGEGAEEGEGEEGHMPLSMAGDAGMYPPEAGVYPPDVGMYPPEEYDGYGEYEEGDDGGQPPSPYYGFVGPVEKLLTYPPAPAKGGIAITNQDLFCLNEGEFLNDVILDFYLKYIFLEKLSEEDRQRTHIFSSFFFKRLTQKQARSAQDQEEVKLTLPERRHSRVRTWTRQVDIFSKDFLLIPINENAHWFLAIVCFPSQEGEEYVSFQPAPLCEPEEPEKEKSTEGDSESATPAPAPAPASQPPEQKTEEETAEKKEEDPDSLPDVASSSTTKEKEESVLGTVIPKESALQSQPEDYQVGLKQPCILVMDSLMGPSRNSIIKILKEYLQVEWDLKKGTPHDMMNTVKGGCPHVPQQNNFSDCGVYVLQYAESFFDNPIANFALPMKLERWFPRSIVERKREEIGNLILNLKAEVDSR